MINKTNMYQHSVYQWNPFVGCKHQCVYCLSSFQAQIKRWAKKNCPECYKFEPHYRHLEDRLKQQLPRTKFMQFIFTCSNGDVAFCKTESLRKIVDRIRSESSKTFLIQSKDPEKFNRLIFPDNVILGITLETNRNKNYGKYSKAPIPSKRYGDFLAVKHPLKMVTVEPVMDFDLNVMVHWIKKINPCMVPRVTNCLNQNF